jgi:uncharacterized membrane protein (DUF485 family)
MENKHISNRIIITFGKQIINESQFDSLNLPSSYSTIIRFLIYISLLSHKQALPLHLSPFETFVHLLERNLLEQRRRIASVCTLTHTHLYFLTLVLIGTGPAS